MKSHTRLSRASTPLVGGYAGPAVAASGFGVLPPGGWTNTLIFIVLSPLIGALSGFTIPLAALFAALTFLIIRTLVRG